MQKSSKVEIRVTDLEKKDWQEAAGGARLVSSWLRSLANAEVNRLTRMGTDLPVPNEKPLIVADATSKGLTREGGSPRLDKCPRWMHHRPGVYCGSCKKVVKK